MREKQRKTIVHEFKRALHHLLDDREHFLWYMQMLSGTERNDHSTENNKKFSHRISRPVGSNCVTWVRRVCTLYVQSWCDTVNLPNGNGFIRYIFFKLKCPIATKFIQYILQNAKPYSRNILEAHGHGWTVKIWTLCWKSYRTYEGERDD